VSLWNAAGLSEAKAVALMARHFSVAVLSEVGRPSAVALARLDGMGCCVSHRAGVEGARASGGVAIVWDASRFDGQEVARCDSGAVEWLLVDLTHRWGPADPLRVAAAYAPPGFTGAALVDALAVLLGMSPDLVGGDFNSRHVSWDPITPSDSPAASRGGRLVTLLGTAGWVVTAPATPTCHRALGGSVLDLFLTPFGGVAPTCLEPIMMPSDHRRIDCTYGVSSPPLVALPWLPHPRIRWASVRSESREAVKVAVAAALGPLCRGVRSSLASPRPPLVAHCPDRVASLFLRHLRTHTACLPHARCGSFPRNELPSVTKARLVAEEAWSVVHAHARAGLAVAESVAAARVAMKGLSEAHARAEGPAPAFLSSAAAWRLYNSAVAVDVAPLPAVIYDPDGAPHSTPAAQLAMFARVFADKCAAPDPAACEVPLPELGPEDVWVPISEVEVMAALRECDIQTAADPDGVDAVLISMVPVSALCTLFDLVVLRGLPDRWRCAYVTPVLKPGKPPDQALSYRPVSNTSLFCRVLERVIHPRLTALASCRFHRSQAGFVRGCGVDEPLVTWSLALADSFRQEAVMSGRLRQFRTITVAVDFVDAFCRVRPASVDRELARRKVPMHLRRFVMDFLRRRVQAVRGPGGGCGRGLSALVRLILGAPQGSVIGPWIWDLLVDPLLVEMEDCLKRFRSDTGFPQGGRGRSLLVDWFGLLAYADDSLFWLSGTDIPAMAAAANRILALVAAFCLREGISPSSKSSALCISRRTLPDDEMAAVSTCMLQCGDISFPLRVAGTEKFLGLTIDDRGTFAPHVSLLCARAGRIMAVLRSIRSLLSPATCRELVVATVGSICLFGISAWLPGLSAAGLATMEHLWLEAARVIVDAVVSTDSVAVLAEAGFLPFAVTGQRRALLHIEKVRRRPPLCPHRQMLLRIVHTTTRGGSAPPCIRDWGDKPLTPMRPLVPEAPPLQSLCWASRVRFSLAPPGGLPKSGTQAAVLRCANATRLALELTSLGPSTVLVWTDGSVCPADDVSPPRSGAAFLISDAAGVLLEQGMVGLGEAPCSFTAEHAAICLALTAVAARYMGRPVLLLSDSLSCLTMVGTGPCSQRDSLGSSVWDLLLKIAQSSQVSMAFVFSHCDWPPHEQVDALAQQAAALSPTPWPVWWRDSARPARLSLRKGYEDSARQSRYFSHAPSLLQSPPRVPADIGKFLIRMRMGVDPGLGGWKHGPSEACRHCGAPLGRSPGLETGVSHLFVCPYVSALRDPHDPKLEYSDLWVPTRWPLVLKLRQAYVASTV
jgi:hypothetical protein